MRLIEAEQKILSLNQPIIKTNDVATYLKISYSHASKLLARLVQAGKFVRLMRGKWATTKQLDPLILPEYLTAPFPTYISLQTALFYHGMISQIPHTIYAVSLARTQQVKTEFANISIHHLQPEFFFDFEMVGDIKIATPEKALIDILYLGARSKLFKSLPEVEIPKSFNFKKANAIIKKIPSKRVRTIVLKKLTTIF